MIASLCAIVLVLIILYMKPVDGHLTVVSQSPFKHLTRIVWNPDYGKAFASTVLVATGGFMLMPFASAFAVNNNGISLNELPLLYMASGICAMVTAPFIGKLSDTLGKYIMFCICSVVMIVSVAIYCNLEITPLWVVIIFSVVIFTTYAGRMISSTALLTAVPEHGDRGAFMSINSSVNMISGGIASLIAGAIVYQTHTGYLLNYDILGYAVSGATVITMIMMYRIDKMVRTRT
jgi:predicted MFS family arabinose efflux permease